MKNINLKQIATAALILFVLASAGYLIMKNLGGTPANVSTGDTGQNIAPGSGDKLVVYYFHGTARCDTCMKIEAYTEEALRTGFPDALKDGRLEWRPVNAEKPENSHYIKDYSLSFRTVVLSDVNDGKESEWKSLDRVWELTGNKQAFIEYIQGNVKPYLEAA